MDARIVNKDDKEKKLVLEAVGKKLDTPEGSISVKVSTNCEHVHEDLKLLENATCAFFLKAFPRIEKNDRESVIDQYITRINSLLAKALTAVNNSENT